MTISIGIFIILIWNVAMFLAASKTIGAFDKKKATLFAVMALILSLMPWVKSPISSLNQSASVQYSMY